MSNTNEVWGFHDDGNGSYRNGSATHCFEVKPV